MLITIDLPRNGSIATDEDWRRKTHYELVRSIRVFNKIYGLKKCKLYITVHKKATIRNKLYSQKYLSYDQMQSVLAKIFDKYALRGIEILEWKFRDGEIKRDPFVSVKVIEVENVRNI